MKTIAIAIVICTSMMSFAIPGRAAETLTLFPDRLIQRRGDNGGQALSALKEQDQQGTADDWDSYLELIPDRARYRGDFIFTLPQDVRIADLTSISLLTNYRGAQIQEQRWQWRIRDFAQRRWLSVGDNASAGDWEWTPMQFAITRPPADLVNARRKLRVRYQSAQPLDSSELDYLALQLKLRSDPGRDDWWRPEPSTSWQWQLSGQIDTTRDVAMYDLDLFETPEQTIDDLKAQGRTVVCYFSAGTWEPYRPDSDQFPERLLGRTLPDWPDEKWLDIRKLKTLAPIMEARLDLAVAKGCDGVEPDLVDAYSNDSGFPISAADQLRYNRWLAAQAHARGLSVGLKNDLEQVAQLVDVFDWALNEQCFQYQECDLLLPFIEQGKAVFGVEYSDQPGALDPADYCPRANAMGFSWLVKTFDLDASGQACWSYSDTDWQPPRSAADWAARPVRGAVIEIGYGGPDEYRDPPYPTVESLRRLRALGVRVVALEFQFTWRILPPYRPDRARIELLRNALDNLAEAGLYAVLAVRNGPGRNAMMPDVRDKDVITTFYEDRSARQAYRAMLQDLVRRFRDRPEIIAWEPMVEPAPDFYLTHESEPPYHRATALWKTLAPELIDAIRALDPERPILMEPVNWGGPGAFAAFEPFDDPNIVYSLHSYEPYAYTHQLEPPYRAYPGEFEGEVFDRAALDKLLSPVDDFQARYRVPVVVGEWGGIRWLPGMARYVADQISLFEARGWSWLWYAWDDEEWDERGFELHRGPVRETTGYDPQAPAFAPLLNAWAKNSTSPDALATFPYALETRADGALRLTDPPGGASDQNPAFSPDGRFMIFTRFDNGYNRGPSGLYRIDLSSGETVRLTPPEDQDNVNLPGGSWNRVKKRIVFAS
ncbi:MAG TPA: hypothetical protein ENK50_05640, partial [Sedimenticola sp.]|nr:hypothetical protein [Sedimenticola sp.]